MNTFPNDTLGDVRYWRLTPAQEAHHRARVVRHSSYRYTVIAVRYARRAVVAARVGVALAVAAIVYATVLLAVGA